jgi:hypothetical protein
MLYIAISILLFPAILIGVGIKKKNKTLAVGSAVLFIYAVIASMPFFAGHLYLN